MTHLEKVIQIMSDPDFYEPKPEKVEVIHTHISVIFIAGDYVYKVKKPVNFGFLDFSTLDKRKHYCEMEVKLNSRFSPDIYIKVAPIVYRDAVIEYAVVMKKLPTERSLKNLLKSGEIKDTHIINIADKIAEIHEKAPTNSYISSFGTVENFRINTDENFDQTKDYINITIDEDTYNFIKERTERFYQKHSDIINKRALTGCVKDCHGDLHSEHIIVADKIYIFDCIEFNERFRFIDTACDIAFLLMDLDYMNFNKYSKLLLTEYLNRIRDDEMLIVLPLFKSYRAYVRGKVHSFMSSDPSIPEDERKKHIETAREYFKLSSKYMEEADL